MKETAEANSQDLRDGVLTEQKIYTGLILCLFKVMETRPLNYKRKDYRHELRLRTITLLHLFFNFLMSDDQTSRYLQLIKMCFKLLQTDSEEIGSVAVKILTNFLQSQSSQKVQAITLGDVQKESLHFCENYLQFLKSVPALAQIYTSQELEISREFNPSDLVAPDFQKSSGNFQTFACCSLKIFNDFLPRLLRKPLLQNVPQGSFTELIIDRVKDTLIDVFKNFPQVEGSQAPIKYKPTSTVYFFKSIEVMSFLLQPLSYLLSTNIDYLIFNYGEIFKFFIKLAKYIPGDSQDCRNRLLSDFYYLNYVIYQKLRTNQTAEGRQHAQTQRNILKHYLEQLLDAQTLLGSGQPNEQIISQTYQIIQLVVDQVLKIDIMAYYLTKAMQILIVCLLNPSSHFIIQIQIVNHLISYNQKLKEMNVAIIKGPVDTNGINTGIDFKTIDLQVELLTAIVIFCKHWSDQTEQGVKYFAETQPSTAEDEEINVFDSLKLKEAEYVETCGNSFKRSWKKIQQNYEKQIRNNAASLREDTEERAEYIEKMLKEDTAKREQTEYYQYKNIRNLFVNAGSILVFIKELQYQKPTFNLQVMRLLEKLLKYSCHIIHNISQFNPSQYEKQLDIYMSLHQFLYNLPVNQFKDLLNATGDTVFGLIIEARAKNLQRGMPELSKSFLTYTPPIQLNPQQQQQPATLSKQQRLEENFKTTFIDMFFEYTKHKISIFDTRFEEKGPKSYFGLSKQDKKMASQLSFSKLQEALQRKLLTIGEQCLQRATDVRVKHTFFGIFVFCIQQIRSGNIVPKYFYIIRNLWKEICNIDDHSMSIKEIMRDYNYMNQGLIETFLQQKDEVNYVKWTNEICCFVPAKLKHLLDYLPEISKPLVDCMESGQPDQIEGGIHLLQYWLSALATYPELLDPVIGHILPDLHQCLKTLIFQMPNISLKLMGKLGSRTRQYDHNNEFKPRNYSEDGLKICLTDKHSKEQIFFGIDSVIDVLLIKIYSYGDQFSPGELNQAVAFVRCAFLSYIDPDLDIEFVIANIISANQQNCKFMNQFKAPPVFKSFDARKPQEPISQMTHGSESHVFEKILRCLIMGCSSLPTNTPENKKVQEEHINFMAWVTKYFTLIYICKNGNLTQPCQIDEINPVLFIEYVVEFLYFNVQQGNFQKQKIENYRPYYKGSSFAIKTMIKLLKELYEDQEEVFDNLEIVQLLIKKICCQVDDLAHNLAVNIAIKILIKHLPARTVKKNAQILVNTLFKIMQWSNDSVVVYVCGEIKLTIEKLFDKIGIFTQRTQSINTLEDRNTFIAVVDRVFQTIISQQAVARVCAIELLEKIAKINKTSVCQLLDSVRVQINYGVEFQGQQPQQQTWHDFLYLEQFERKIKDVFEMYRGSYSAVKQLIQMIEMGQFLLKFSDQAQITAKRHVFIGLVDLLVLVLEDESDKFESILEQRPDHITLGPNSTLNKLSRRYMKLERIYLQQNREYDTYSHTMHTHQFLESNYFEVASEARDIKFRKEVDALKQKQSWKSFGIYDEQSTLIFETVKETATTVLESSEQYEQVKKIVKDKIEAFTSKLFGNNGRVQDICYEYMQDLYEMYPNVSLHCNLINKIFQFLCDIVCHDSIYKFIKDRQTEFFHLFQTNLSAADENTNDSLRQPQYLQNKFDFYTVEVKAKMIFLLFKFFQRDERKIQKQARNCLKRLLKYETNANEALPNNILKECVRPILNSMALNQNGSTSLAKICYYQHFGKLIKVCHTYFNEELGKHLTNNYKGLEVFVKSPYVTDQINEVELRIKELVDQYNIKIRQIETACGIINSLHFLCHQRTQMMREIKEVMQSALNFNEYLIEEFQNKFDIEVVKITADGNAAIYQLAYDKISPLRVKLGYLESNLQQGVAKFFTSNFKEGQEILFRTPYLQTFLQIVQKRENYSLRERLTREGFLKNYLLSPQNQGKYPQTESGTFINDEKLLFAVNLIHIFSKFNPQYLVQQKNVYLIDILREKWVNKIPPLQFLMTNYRDIYTKILKSLVVYCRSENCDTQILFDLLKDLSLQATFLDMRPLVKLCTQFIPKNYSVPKKINLMMQTLDKIYRSKTANYEAKYCMFEFAFMPIALQCTKDQVIFKTYFTRELIQQFLQTFFQMDPQRKPFWQIIHDDLQERQKISYQSFFTEITKVLLIIIRYTDMNTIQQCFPGTAYILFLDWNAKNAIDLNLKELSYFTMSCFGVNFVGLRISGEPVQADKIMVNTNGPQPDQNVVNVMRDNVLKSVLSYNLGKVQKKQLLKLTLQNIIQFARLSSSLRQDFWELLKQQYNNETELQPRLLLCAMISNLIVTSDIPVDKGIYRRLTKVLFQFKEYYYRGLALQNFEVCKEPFQILDAIIHLTRLRKEEAQGNHEIEQQIQTEVYEVFTITTQIQQALTFVLDMSQPKHMDLYSQYACHCLRILRKITQMFPSPKTYTHCFDFKLFKEIKKYQLQAMFYLNFFSLAVTEKFNLLNQIQIFLDFFAVVKLEQLSLASANFRLILFPIHILKNVIRQKNLLLTSEQIKCLRESVIGTIEIDLQKARSRVPEYVQGEIVKQFKQEQFKYYEKAHMANSNQLPPLISTSVIKKVREIELILVQKFIPHFTIRAIKALEDLRDEGVLSAEEFQTWVKPDFYKQINNQIYRVVSCFRQVITQEKIPIEQIRLDRLVTQTYETYNFRDNQVDFCLDQPNLDTWMKETIVIGFKSTIKNMKQNMHQDEACTLFENLKQTLKVFHSVKCCQYLMDQIFEITELLVVDRPLDKVKLLAKEKAGWLIRLTQSQRFKDTSDGKEKDNSLVNRVYGLCLDFLDLQPSLQQNEISLKIFDRLFLLKPCCNYELRQRLFQIFEKFTGSALKHKIQYFMFKVSSEDFEQFISFCQINNLLDFLLYSFKQDTKMSKIRESSRLISMHNENFRFILSEEAKEHEKYKKTKQVLLGFSQNLQNYKNIRLEDMVLSLSEIIRINPEHSHDRGIAEKIFSKIFWQIWEKLMHRQEQHQFAADFNKMAQNLIKYSSQINQQVKSIFCRTMFEQVISLRHPQVRIEPEVLQFMAKNFNLWHIAIPMLEDHVQLFPSNERYVFALQELYDTLMEEDYNAGLSRLVTKSREMRSMVSLAQHHMWEDMNQQFGSYINFYAEQEGLFPFLENQQKTPGKYSRQLAKNALIDMINGSDPCNLQPIQPTQNQNFNDVFETQEVAAKLSYSKYPKEGSNRSLSEIDLRSWENLYMKSLRILKVQDLFKNIADNITSEQHELKVEYSWAFKDMLQLKGQLQNFLNPNPNSKTLKFSVSQNSIQKVKYHLYYSFLLGTPPETQNRNAVFEENYKETIKLAIHQWATVLPQYMDRIQNEYLIMFQQIIESMEGGRNMISIQEMRRISDYRCAINIWRERLPKNCESIETWQEILESRNFIFQSLRDNIIKQQQQPLLGEVNLSLSSQEEPVDICWNNLKLAKISRKHNLLGLAQYYLNLVKAPLRDPETKGENLKLERYLYLYENFKLNLGTGIESVRQQEILHESKSFLDNKDYESWMHANILRLQGDHFLKCGDLANAKSHLLSSIEKNRKEAKTWLSYAKLNETVLTQTSQQTQEKAIINSLKGYLCALSTSQHKARYVIPYILRLLKNSQQQPSKTFEFMKTNVDQLPAWLWLFWIPQLLQLLKQPEGLQREIAKHIYSRLCKMYPQISYYPLRSKQYYLKRDQFKDSVFQELLKENTRQLKRRNSRAAQGINCLLDDVKNLFSNKEHQFVNVLQDLINFSGYLMSPQRKNIEANLQKMYVQVYECYLKGTNNPILNEFYNHFINEETREVNFIKQMQILKNIKDFLVVQKSLKVQTQHIDDVFPNFANLNVKGIEIPDQYILIDSEPLLQKIITIDRIDSTVHRAGWNDKKIEFKCQNSKSIYYLFSGLLLTKKKQHQEIIQFQSDERVTQIKIIMNMLFAQHKESHIRGTKIQVTPKILLLEAKMSQDDMSFVDFQETHDFLLLEQGVDPDQALVLQLAQIQSKFESFPFDKPRELQHIDQQSVRDINQDTYNQLTTVVEPYLLQSYFNRIFYNVDHLFIFKKQFTKYLAVNSFFSYVFNQSEQLKLNTLVFCKASGKFSFTDPKLSLVLQKKEVFKNRSFQDVDLDFFRSIDRQGETAQENTAVPFRLTPNMVHFIGQIGLQGLFAGVMTSVSFALMKQEDKFGTLLKLIFADEIAVFTNQATPLAQAQAPQIQTSLYDEDQIADFCMFKTKSLINHSAVLQQPAKSEECKAQPIGFSRLPGIREDRENFILGQAQQNEYVVPRELFDLEMERPMVMEEFNKKVFSLIDIAQEDSRRCQKPINWCAWF